MCSLGERLQPNPTLFWVGGLAPLLGVYSWPGLSLGYQHLAWAKKNKRPWCFRWFSQNRSLLGASFVPRGSLGLPWGLLGPFGATLASLSSSLGLLGGTLGSHGLHLGPFLAHQVRPNLTIGTSERGPSGHRAKLAPEGVCGTTPKWILCMK